MVRPNLPDSAPGEAALEAFGSPGPLAADMVTETRPWGWFSVIDKGPGFKVKRVVVRPGGRLSLQSHKHRSEHWTVVSGVATVTLGVAVHEMVCGRSIDIPLGERHRLENFGSVDLELIEVQLGDYLGEDDVVRYDDAYDRA